MWWALSLSDLPRQRFYQPCSNTTSTTDYTKYEWRTRFWLGPWFGTLGACVLFVHGWRYQHISCRFYWWLIRDNFKFDWSWSLSLSFLPRQKVQPAIKCHNDTVISTTDSKLLLQLFWWGLFTAPNLNEICLDIIHFRIFGQSDFLADLLSPAHIKFSIRTSLWQEQK